MTQKERSEKATKRASMAISDTAFFDSVEDSEDAVRKVRKYKFADIDKKQSWSIKKIVAYMNEENNTRIAMKVSDWKNINNNIKSKVVRNLKVVTVGEPTKIDEHILRFLTHD